MIEVRHFQCGNIAISAVDEEPTALFGFGNNPLYYQIHAGELKFDMYIDSAGTDLDSTIQVKMDSGYPALGFKELQVQ